MTICACYSSIYHSSQSVCTCILIQPYDCTIADILHHTRYVIKYWHVSFIVKVMTSSRISVIISSCEIISVVKDIVPDYLMDLIDSEIEAICGYIKGVLRINIQVI